MIKLIETACTYYVIGVLVSQSRKVDPEEFGYNSLMWGPVLVRNLYYRVVTYLAKFQAEIISKQQQEEDTN
jgi:hypothetical protein